MLNPDSSSSSTDFINAAIAVFATTFSIYGIWTSTESKIYGEESVELAEWTSKKDFLETCQSNHFVPPGCEEVKGDHVPPPPKVGNTGRTSTLSIVLVSTCVALLLCLIVWPYLVRKRREWLNSGAATSSADISLNQINSQPGSASEAQPQGRTSDFVTGSQRDIASISERSLFTSAESVGRNWEIDGEPRFWTCIANIRIPYFDLGPNNSSKKGIRIANTKPDIAFIHTGNSYGGFQVGTNYGSSRVQNRAGGKAIRLGGPIRTYLDNDRRYERSRLPPSSGNDPRDEERDITDQ